MIGNIENTWLRRTLIVAWLATVVPFCGCMSVVCHLFGFVAECIRLARECW